MTFFWSIFLIFATGALNKPLELLLFLNPQGQAMSYHYKALSTYENIHDQFLSDPQHYILYSFEF